MSLFPAPAFALALMVGAAQAGAVADLRGGPTPAERRVAAARAATTRTPHERAAWIDLGMALARRARETSDANLYAQGLQAVDHALSLAPQDFEALKARAWLLLGQHRFAEALEIARLLNTRAPDDVIVYGLLTDASVELGRYAEAERACQWMLDLRPGNTPALTRASYLRELFGDVEGALELMVLALDQIGAGEVEERAWVLTQIGHLRLELGRHAEAEAALQQALEAFPGYHYTLGQLARLRGEQGRHAEAARMRERHYAAAPHPENLYELAAALQRAGRRREARLAFARFEGEARAEMASPDNANRELIDYYVDHARRPAEALRLAQAEMALRGDVFTRAAYARALQANGRRREARRQMEIVLSVGTRDARLLRQARHLGLRTPSAARVAANRE
jgi:tetratricopeptide (TPR) repeat protein